MLGPEVEAFEAEFAAASGAAHAVGVGNGTDALALILRALGIGPGDEVITTPLSAAYTALAVLMAGARPVFADIDPERLTLDADAIAAAVTPRTRAILPVHLVRPGRRHGARSSAVAVAPRPGDRRRLLPGAPRDGRRAAGRHDRRRRRLQFLSDQEPRRARRRRRGRHRTTRALADRVRRLRNGGQTDRYHHQEPGVNSRLDEMQAAILRARLPFLPALDGPPARRSPRRIAARWRGAAVTVPAEADAGHVYHLFVVRDGRAGDALQQHLAGTGIETLVHYPLPIPRQPALAARTRRDCPRAAAACDEVLSLPLHPGLDDREVAEVAAAVREFQ